mgnify:CR=1 FL=1
MLKTLQGLSMPRRSILRRYSGQKAARPGNQVRKARKAALLAVAIFSVIATIGATLVILGIGIPGRAWG